MFSQRTFKLTNNLFIFIITFSFFGCSNIQKTPSKNYHNFSQKKIPNQPTAKVQNNICLLFENYSGWYESSVKSSKKWKIPIHTMMAFIKQESSFKAKARPPVNSKLSGFSKISTAYGYAQAKTNTWKDYQYHTKQSNRRRDNFEHSVDFIGWYLNRSMKLLSLKNYDTYNLYLSYHEGWTGYKIKTYNKKPWLTKVATRVKNNGYKYFHQLKKCGGIYGNYKLKNTINFEQYARIEKVDNKKIKKVETVKPKSKIRNTIRNSNGCKKYLGFWPICTPFN